MCTARNDLREVFRGLSLTDKLLPLLIICAIVLGVLLSVYVPSSRTALDSSKVVGVSVPLAVGLIVMLLPPLCKVEWENLHKFFSRSTYIKPVVFSLVLNWIICPFFMFGLAWLTLFDEPEYRTGIIMIGLARCIAMVLLWNDIALGDPTLCAVIVIVNSVLQMVLYAPYQIFFCYVITGHYQTVSSTVTYSMVAKSVAFFMGIPFGLGALIRLVGRRLLGAHAYDKKFVPFVSPWGLIGLLYTIVVIFMEKGNDFIKDIGSAFRCFVPLVVYFICTFFGTLFLLRSMYAWGVFESRGSKSSGSDDEMTKLCGCEETKELFPEKFAYGCAAPYGVTIAQTFTAASNNFELSLAIAISIYGSGSKQAIAATFGPLIEVPVLLLLVFVARYFRVKFVWTDVTITPYEVMASSF
ncbi:arsenical-resistance protein [Candidozyma auris]|nr:arsenical-resistance protein [[Candida] auris]